jgi:carboxypeptidase C (cathepsin A)
MKALSLAVFGAILSSVVFAANNVTDKVISLPSCAPLPSNWWSGFLNISPTKSLHYIFIESLNNATTDPILIWLNGGPGCSSMLGLFQENGPFIFDDGESIIKPNPYPWNMKANLLYIESPAGVGFSVANTTNDLLHSDMSQSEDAFAGLKDFYNAFPKYRNNELYLTGESYGGIYVPYLAWQIHQWNLVQKMNKWNDTYNLLGFAVGNGYTDPMVDSNVLYPQTLFSFNLISWDLMNRINQAGCVWYWDKLDVAPHKNAPGCEDLWTELNNMLIDVNIYDLYRTNYAADQLKAEKPRLAKTIVDGTERTYLRGHTVAEKAPWLKAIFGENHPSLQRILGGGMSDYLNRADVRTALNIPNWILSYQECNDPMYATYMSYREGSVWIYPILKAYGYRLLHYSGDTDGAIPTLGTRTWIQQQGWNVTKDWRPYTTEDQVSGYVIDYDNFQFVTIHGVGHMAPQWKREDVTGMITKFVQKIPIA